MDIHLIDTLRNAYLELLQKSLTDTLYKPEPDQNTLTPASFVLEFSRHYIKGNSISLLPQIRFLNLRKCIESVIADNIPGDLIEAGVWRGGAAIFMRAMLRAYNVPDRTIWVADSFEGLPIPDATRFPKEARAHESRVVREAFENFSASLEEVRANFAAYGLLDDQVAFLNGWFRDTLPAAPIQHLALLRLDGDFYESTMDTLTYLYNKVSPGGYIIVDDYGEEGWTHCREAVDTFRSQRNIHDEMIQVDSKCWFWRKAQDLRC